MIQEGILSIPNHLKTQIKRLGLSVAMHSCFPKVKNNENIYIWSDNQALSVIESFKNSEKAHQFYLKTGTPIHPMTPFAKIMFFNREYGWGNDVEWCGLKELIFQKFTGKNWIDYATASATGLLNLKTLQWDSEILDFLGIKNSQLAKLVEVTNTSPIKPDIASTLNLPSNLEVMIGASDGSLATYAGFCGTGIPNSLSIGTSAAIRKVSSQPQLCVEKQNFCYYFMPGTYIIGAPSNNGGNVIEWAKAMFFSEELEFESLISHNVEYRKVGANGLKFWPYVFGERAPYWNADKKSAFINLTSNHSKNDLAQSILEGLLLNVRQLMTTILPISTLTINGGFFSNELFSQQTANILGVECFITERNEPIFGLYYLLMKHPEVNQRLTTSFFPDQTISQEYKKLAQTYFEDQ